MHRAKAVRHSRARSGAARRRHRREPREGRRMPASPGDLDPSFGGGDGIGIASGALASIFPSTNYLGRQSTGDLLIASDTGDTLFQENSVVRFNPDGSLDTTF